MFTLLLGSCFIVAIAGCSESKVERLEKAYQLAKKLSAGNDLSDTQTIKYSRMSAELLERIATLKIEASNRQVYVLDKLYNSYYDLEMWPRAARTLDQLIQLQPSTAEWYIEKGRVMSRWAKVDKTKIPRAEQAFKTALELKPDSLRARYGLGLLYGFHKNEPAKARNQLRKVINTRPLRAKHIGEVIDARFALAKLEFQEGNLRDSAKVYRNLLEMEATPRRTKFQVYKNMGRVYRKMGSMEMAKRMYRKAQELYPENSEVREALSSLGAK